LPRRPNISAKATPDRVRLRNKLVSGGIPYLTLKAAVSLDGRIATRGGESKWITGALAREFGHRLRANHDAVMVGRGTVVADDPQLNVRVDGFSTHPARVVLDSKCAISPKAKCLADDGAQRIIITGNAPDADAVKSLEKAGVDVIQCSGEKPNAKEFLPLLRERGIASILVEGGAAVHAGLIANGLPDELFLIVAGMVFGGEDAPGWCTSLGIDRLEEAPRLKLRPPFVVGEDVVIHGVFNH